jgi:hypothetical protein
MPSSIANVSVSASSFAGGLFLGLCITRIVFSSVFLIFAEFMPRRFRRSAPSFCGLLATDAM